MMPQDNTNRLDTIDMKNVHPGRNFKEWALGLANTSDVWAVQSESSGKETDKASYVNLLDNPEGYTGYG